MTEKTVDIEVHYTLHLNESNFKKVLKEAEELGHDFNDAGKLLTVRRYLQMDGIDAVEELLQDPQAIKITSHKE